MICQSKGTTASETPERPPIGNIIRKPTAKSSGVFVTMLPPQSVAVQLKTFTAVGMAISVVEEAKKASATSGRPVANMWCTQTTKERKPIATEDQAMKM